MSVVGYHGRATEAVKYPFFGGTFVPVSGAETYSINEIKPSGNINGDDDTIQLVNPVTLGTLAQYRYCSLAFARECAINDGEEIDAYDFWVGWYKAVPGMSFGDDKYRADDVTFPVGQVFLGLFKSGEDVTFTFAGEAPMEPTPQFTDAKKYAMIENVVPRAIDLSWMTAENINGDDDTIQVLNTTTLGTVAQYKYCSLAFARECAINDGEEIDAYDFWVGWYNAVPGMAFGNDKYRAVGVTVNPGDAFLGLFKSGENIQFNFPGSLYEGPKDED